MPHRFWFRLIYGYGPCLLLLNTPVLAQTEEAGVETIVVTGSRLEKPTGEMPQSLEIVTRAEIEVRQYANVTELLRHVAGMNIIQQGARGGVTTAVLRGAEPNFTVVLIDGIKINDSTNTRGGSYDFSYLDLGSVERVEIVRGPLSAVYGSDALAGVINIITRDAGDGVGAKIEVGGHGLAAGSVRLGGDVGRGSGAFGVHALTEDGDIEGANYSDFGLDGSIDVDLADGGRAGALVRYQDAESTGFPEDSGGPELAVIRDVDRRTVQEAHLRLFIEMPVGNAWTASASINRYDRGEDYSSPGIAPGLFDGVPPNSADTDFTRDQVSLSFRRDSDEGVGLVLGAEWQGEDGESNGEIDFGFPVPTDFRLERDTLSVFSEVEWRFDTLLLQGSLRRDDPDGIDAETTVQLGTILSLPGEAGELRLNWGEAFKAPSFFALAHPLVGNRDLVSETATSIDFGYRYSWSSGANIEISFYRNEFKNLIDFDPELFTNVNRSKVVTDGVELTASFELSSSVNADLHVTNADSEIRNSDARLRGRPEWRGGITVDWQISDRLRFAGSILSLDEFYEVSIPTGGVFLDGYTRLDLALTYRASEHINVGFAIDNVLDEDYFEAVGFSAAGVRGRVSAAYRF